MATFQTQQRIPHLGLAVSEDPMEVTTDTEPRLEAGDDIDIDLDLTGDGQQDGEDEYMDENDEEITDEAPIPGNDFPTADDDEMADDGYVEGSVAGRSSVHDEDLEDADYVEDAFADVVVGTDLFEKGEHIDASQSRGSTHDHEIFDVTNYADDNHHEQSGKYESESNATVGTSRKGQKEASSIDHYTASLVGNEVTREKNEEHSYDQQSILGSSHEGAELSVHNLSQEQNGDNPIKHIESRYPGTKTIDDTGSFDSNPSTNLGNEQEEMAAAADQLSALSSKLESETITGNETVVAEPILPVDSTNVHPVVVVYQDSKISLFPPVDQEADEEEDEQRSSTYFLQDERLASDSIQNLLGHLRSVLGESIGEEDELTIDIVELGLRISESSTDCSTTSLSDIVDIYVHLQHYDGLDSPPPLHMNLTTIARFPHRLESLLLAIADKKGLSQTRSSYVTEERPQIEAEVISGQNVTEALLQNHMTLGQRVKTSVPLQNENTWGSHGEETTENGSVSPSCPSSQPESLSSPLQVVDEASGDGPSHEQEATAADYQPSDDPQTGPTDPSPWLALPFESKRHGLEESTVDDDDFIDYEDDKQLTQGHTSSSSTLQGDALDGTVDENNFDPENEISNRETAKVQVNGRTQKADVGEEGPVHDDPYDGYDDHVTEMGDMVRPQPVESDREQLKHSNEGKPVASTDGCSVKEMISKNIEQPRHLQNHGILPTGKAKYDDDKERGQPEDEAVPLQADVTQEQQSWVNDNDSDLARKLLENEPHGGQSTTNGPDYQTIGDADHKYESHWDFDAGHESTKVRERAITPNVENGEVVDNAASSENTEALLLLDGANQPQDDNDEITYEDNVPEKHSPAMYEDEIDHEQILTKPITAWHNSVPSPESHKRPRSLHEDNDDVESDLQGEHPLSPSVLA